MGYEEYTFLALGSNLGNRNANLTQATKDLSGYMQIHKKSSICETLPMAGMQQPSYLNQVLMVQENFLPEDLLLLVKKIEQAVGRKPAARWAPRIIDIDIIFKGYTNYKSNVLTIPHIGYSSRGFVLGPIAEIAPDFVPPDSEFSVSKLFEELL